MFSVFWSWNILSNSAPQGSNSFLFFYLIWGQKLDGYQLCSLGFAGKLGRHFGIHLMKYPNAGKTENRSMYRHETNPLDELGELRHLLVRFIFTWTSLTSVAEQLHSFFHIMTLYLGTAKNVCLKTLSQDPIFPLMLNLRDEGNWNQNVKIWQKGKASPHCAVCHRLQHPNWAPV